MKRKKYFKQLHFNVYFHYYFRLKLLFQARSYRPIIFKLCIGFFLLKRYCAFQTAILRQINNAILCMFLFFNMRGPFMDVVILVDLFLVRVQKRKSNMKRIQNMLDLYQRQNTKQLNLLYSFYFNNFYASYIHS